MKHINLTQMLQGCSKRNGMTVSASGSDGAQTSEVKRQTLSSKKEKWSKNEALHSTCLRSASVPLSFRSRYLRYAAVIFCVLAMSVGQAWGVNMSLRFTESVAAFYTETQFCTNFYIAGNGEKKTVQVASSSKTIDGTSFTYCLKLSGTGNSSGRYIKFAVTGPCTIKTYGNTSKSDTERSLTIYNGTTSSSLKTGYCTSSTSAASEEYEYTGSAATLYIYSTSDGYNVYGIDVTYASTPRTFNSGQEIFFKDYSANITWGDLKKKWVSDGGHVYAYFWNDTENAWSAAGTVVSGSDGAANAVYKITVPGSGKEYTKVLFTRGNAGSWEGRWNQTTDQTPDEGYNMFCISNDGDYVGSRDPKHKWKGTWSKYGYPAALVGNFNGWSAYANVFPNSGVSSVNLDDLTASTSYKFKVLQGESYCGVGSGTITGTTTDWWHLDGANDVYITTGTTGRYTFAWNTSTYYLGVYYPGGVFEKNKYIYFNVKDETYWNKKAFTARFYFKYVDSGTDLDDMPKECSTPVENYVYYTTVPYSDYAGQIQMNRYVDGGVDGISNICYAYSRGDDKKNCMTHETSKANYKDSWTPQWTTYCPPMSKPTLSDNSPTTYGGSGTSESPYIVATGTSITLTASGSTSAVDDDNMTAKYQFKDGATSKQDGTGTTYTLTASSTDNTTHTMTVEAYNYYNETSSTHTASDAIYYKAKTIYDIAYKKGSNGTGTEYTDKKVKGTNITLRGAIFNRTGYTQTAWNTNSAGTGGTSYTLSGSYTSNADVTLYPTWTAKTTSVTLNPNTAHHGTGSNVVATATFDGTSLSGFSAATPAAGYRLEGYYTAATSGDKILNANGSFVKNTTYTTNDGTPKWKSELATLELFAHYVDETYTVSNTLSNVIKSGGETSATHGTNYTATFTANTGYTLPSDATVSIGGVSQTKGTGYTWTISDGTATLTIPGANVTGAISISVEGALATYSITYNCDGAESGCPSNVAAATNLPSPLPSGLTKTGYNFSAWYTNSEKTIPAAAGDALTENTTLYAKWTAKTTTITINANSGNHGSTTPGSVTATYGNALPLFTAATGESGWNLTGYFTEATSGTKVINANGTLVASTDYADASGNWKYETASLTLYAQYEEEGGGCIDANSTNFGDGNSDGDASKTLDDGTVVAMLNCTNSASSVSIKGNILFTAPTGKAFETFSFVATCGSDGKTNYYKINGGSQQNLESSTKTSKRYTITVPASPNTTTIQIIKSGTTPAVTEFCYTYKDVCSTPTTAFANGAYTVGGSALDLSTLISGKQGSGAITYTVKNANGTGASIAGTSFTATSAGTVTVTATQAANGGYCEKVMDATITVSAAPAGDCHKYFYYGVLSAPSPAPTKNEDSFFSSVPSTGSSASESWEIDDVTYTTSSRCSNSNNIGTFTIPSGKVATMYVMFNGSSSYTMTITKGGSNYKTGIDASSGIKKYTEEDMGPGTYAVTTTGNVGLYLLIVDVCDATPCTVAPTVSATTKGATTSTTQVVNCSGISSLGTGTCTITSYGFVYGTSTNPTLLDSHVEVGTSYTVTGTAFAETTLTGLMPSTTYYVRAYATNGAGTGYGDDVSFTTSAAPVGAPVIMDQPDLSEVALGGTASFSLTATGATSYQWYNCDSEGENKTEVSGATEDNYSYTTTVTGTTYYICKVSNASGDTWSDVVGSIVNPVSFTIHYEAGSENKTSYTTETFTQTKEVNAAVEDYIGYLTKFEFTGVGISDKGKDGTMSMMIDVVGDAVTDTVGKRVSFSFVIANNYQLDIDEIDFQVQPVSKDDESFQVVMTDQIGTTIVGTLDNPKNGKLAKINFPSAQLAKNLVGKVNVVLYGWCTSSETAKYRIAKDFYIRGEVSSLPAPTASWTARPASATVGDGGKTYTLTTDGTYNTVAWSITDQSGATGAALSPTSGLTTTLGSYTTAGSLYVQASVTGDGIHYLSTPATLLRQRVVISAGCVETTLISATLSSCTGTGDVTGTPGGTSTVAFESCESIDGGYKMGKDDSYMRLALRSGNFEANDEVKITITKASDQGDGALHIYKYADASWTELGSVTAAGAGTYSYTLTETNVSTAFNTIGLYRTGKNQNPYVKALSVVRSSCSASKPSGVTVTASPTGPSYAIDDALTLTVSAANADTYQWYSNTNNTASDGFLLVGETANTYSPSTAIAGTTYYYCVATNTSGSTVSNIIEVTVNSAKTAPTVSWTGTDEEPNYGGGGYTVTATVSTAEWDGTLTTDMLTASDGVTLTGVSVSGKVITATYGVTETARSPLSFSLTLPETTNYTALAANKEITFTRCGEGAAIETTETQLPVKSSYTYTTSTKPNYSWQTAGVGWLTLVTGSSSIGSESDSYSGFAYRSNSGKSSITFYSELDAVSAVRIYIKGGGPTTLSKVQKGTTFGKYTKLAPSTDYDYSYSNGSSSIESREQAYIEITFKTALSANTFVEITLSRNTEYYGVGLITGNSEVGNITTALSWATNPGTTVNKYTTDANFRYEAVKASDAASQATLGTISYKSSVPAVATVSATGVVDVLSAGSTTITATLAGSGCYKKATLSYNLVVAAATCTDVAGTITASGDGITIDGNTVTKTDACAAVTLTVSGHTGEDDGAAYQWYKDGVSMGKSYQEKSITVTDNGDYTVEVTNAGVEHCTMPATNTITITGNAISITKIVDEWYVKNGRRTPDIALATIEGITSYTVNDGSSNITTFAGCGFELRDGILYLKGTQDDGSAPSGLAAGDVTLTITAVNACGDDDPTATITIHKQAANASKPSIAFIVDGTKGDPVNSVATTKTSSRPIWIYLSEFFDLTGCNAYWTNNEKLIRQYYSQFDAIVITDDPSTDEKPKSGLKYVNALGTMVDVRPILTMEAYVGKYGASSNWHIGGTPSSPNPRQYELKLQCKDHDIFSDLTTSANFRSEEIDGETYYYVTMVDNSVTPYAGLADDAETGTYPALQGFSAASIKGTGLLGIGTISDGTLQGGVERQDEPTARMMILGIQHQAMAALTSEGKQVIKNAINYLLKTDMEEVDDCSNYFIGGTVGHEQDWHTASNWSSTKVPDASTKARILVPVTISTKVHVAQVDIAVGGRSIRYNSGGTNCSGRVTINPTGALIVDGQVRRTTNGRLYTEEELQPTENDDLIVKAATDAPHRQGALIFDNSDGDTHAVVEMWNPSYWVVEGGKKKKYWSYVAVPIQEADIPNFFWHGFTYLYDETSGWIKKGDGTSLYPFQGIGASLQDGNMETFYGPLATTESQDITLTYTADKGQGMNLIGNSWTAPIQIANFEKDDFGDAAAEVWVFNTGHTNDGHGDGTTTEAGQWNTIPINSAGLPGYEGLKVIPAMQAFEVNTTSETTLHLDYDRLVRAGRENLNEPMRAPRRSAAKQIEATMRVRVSGESTHTDVYLLKDARFSDGFDNGWDGHYLSGDDRSAQLYAISEEEGKLAFLAQPEIEGTQLGFAPSKHGNEYTFSFSYDGDEEYYLNDIKLQKSTQIDAENKYLFTYEEGDANRFFISRQPLGVPEVATGNDAVKEDIKAIKIIYNDKLYIIRAGRVYSAEGILVK